MSGVTENEVFNHFCCCSFFGYERVFLSFFFYEHGRFRVTGAGNSSPVRQGEVVKVRVLPYIGNNYNCTTIAIVRSLSALAYPTSGWYRWKTERCNVGVVLNQKRLTVAISIGQSGLSVLRVVTEQTLLALAHQVAFSSCLITSPAKHTIHSHSVHLYTFE